MIQSDRRVRRLHLLARPGLQQGHITIVGKDEVESGDWRATEDLANAVIGAEIHLHEAQQSKSWHAGTIIGWRWHESGNGRVVYRFRVNRGLARFQRTGWPSRGEQRVVWEDEE